MTEVPGPHIIMDTLKKYHSVDIQWGNHDVRVDGSCRPDSRAVLQMSSVSAARYGNLDILEDGYGINLHSACYLCHARLMRMSTAISFPLKCNTGL